MDPPLINEPSFSALNLSSYTLTEIWPFPVVNVGVTRGDGGSELRRGNSGRGERDGWLAEESTLTGQSGDGGGNGKRRRILRLEGEDSKIVSSTTSGDEMKISNIKRVKTSGCGNENGTSQAELNAYSGVCGKPSKQDSKPSEPPKDYIHVRARSGQATDSQSLAERARREKISERMKILQDLVPGCNKIAAQQPFALMVPILADKQCRNMGKAQNQAGYICMQKGPSIEEPNHVRLIILFVELIC